MKIINKDEFMAKKKGDLAIIYGSGPTISTLTPEQLQKLSEFDSFGFNWICKSKIPMKFYTVREQATTPKRCSEEMGITPSHLINYLNESPYDKSCIIMHDMRGFPNHSYVYSEHMDEFHGEGIVVKELRRKVDVTKQFNAKYYRKDIFSDGVYHGKCSLSNTIHIVIGMGYKKIVFVGVDLFDSRYFWRGEKRYLLIKDVNVPHKVGGNTIEMIKAIDKLGIAKMYSYNKKSLLSSFLEVWRS